MHTDHHPSPVPGCFGCHVSTLGYQGLQSRAGSRKADVTRVSEVVGDDGPARGSVVGKQREHWDGRQDAKVYAPTHKVSTRTTEER